VLCSPFACLFCSFVINELIQTEKQYIEDLAQIVLVCIVSHSGSCVIELLCGFAF